MSYDPSRLDVTCNNVTNMCFSTSDVRERCETPHLSLSLSPPLFSNIQTWSPKGINYCHGELESCVMKSQRGRTMQKWYEYR